MKTDDKQIIKDRKIRMARYLLEDFDQGRNHLKRTGFLLIILGLLYVGSALLFDSNNNFFGFLTMASGGLLLFWNETTDWRKGIEVETGIAVFALIPLLEFFLVGSPEKLIPNLGEVKGGRIIGIITIVNDLSPFVYSVLKLIVVYPFARMLLYKFKLGDLPLDLKKEIGWKS